MILESNTSANTTLQTNASITDIHELNLGVMSFVVFVSIAIVLTNVFVVIFVFRIRDENLRDRVSMILSLGVCDIMVGLGGSLISILVIFQFVDVIFCAFTCTLIQVGAASSLFQTFFICLERFLAVTNKTARNRLFDRRKRYAILITSLTSLTIIFSCTNLSFLPVDIKRCSIYDMYGEHYTNVFRFYMFLLYIPPIIGTIVLYTWTAHRIKTSCKVQASDVTSITVTSASQSNQGNVTGFTQRSKLPINKSQFPNNRDVSANHRMENIGQTRRKNQNNDRNRKQMNALRTVGFIILTMLLTTGIGTVFNLIEVLCPFCVISPYSRNGALTLWVMNSLLNPIIYTFAIREFRQAISNLFKCNSQ